MIEPYKIIEIAFYVWNTPASNAFIRHRGAEHTNIPRTRHLSYYLLSKYSNLSIREIAELFGENRHTAESGYESARSAIESKFITWKNKSMRDKHFLAESIITGKM